MKNNNACQVYFGFRRGVILDVSGIRLTSWLCWAPCDDVCRPAEPEACTVLRVHAPQKYIFNQKDARRL